MGPRGPRGLKHKDEKCKKWHPHPPRQTKLTIGLLLLQIKKILLISVSLNDDPVIFYMILSYYYMIRLLEYYGIILSQYYITSY